MNPNSLTRKRIYTAHQTLLQSVRYCRRNMRSIAIAAALVVVISELGGIWHEIHLMRSEQVKNATYQLSKERRNALPEAAVKRLESSSFVNGTVGIDGPVELNEPVEVEIDR